MAMIGNVVGLDLGSYSLKAVELRRTLRQLEPVQFRCEPRHLPGVSEPERLAHFLRSHVLPAEAIYCAVGGRFLSTRYLEFPFSDRKKLDRAVPFEVEDEVPFELEDLLVEWELIDGDPTHSSVAAVMAARTEIQSVLDPFLDAGLQPRILEAEGFVLANLASVFDLSDSQLILDIGHEKTQLSLIAKERTVFSRTLPIGGKALTQAVSEDRLCSIEDAERIKCEEGIFGAGFETNSPRALDLLDQIAREVVRTLQSPVNLREGLEPASTITLIGGSSKLHKLDEYLCERTGASTRRLLLPPDSADAALVAGGDSAIYATATALALRGTPKKKTRINFRKEEFAYSPGIRQYLGPDLRGTLALAVVVLFLVIGQVITGVVLKNRQAADVKEAVANIYSEAFPGKPIPSNPMAAMSAEISKAEARAEFLGAYGRLQSALDLLVEISDRIPPDLDVDFDDLRIDRSAIRVKAHAKNFEAVDRLKNVLSSAEPFVQTKVAGDVQNDKRRGGVTFSLNIALGG